MVVGRFVPAAATTWAEPAPDALAHQLVAAQAERTPARRAVCWGDRHLTYRELDARAERLARRLAGRGVRPGVAVAVVVVSPPDAVVTTLAVLRAGGTCAPVDPDHPARMPTTPVLVTRRELLPRLPTTRTPLLLDDDHGNPVAHLSDPAHPDDVALTLAEPRRTVSITHRDLVRALVARLDHPTSLLTAAPPVSGGAFAGMFWPLVSGGRLVVPPPEVLGHPLRLARHIAAMRPSHLLCPAPLYRRLLHADPDHLASLRLCMVFGELRPTDLHERHHRILPDTVLVHEADPAEPLRLPTSALTYATRTADAG